MNQTISIPIDTYNELLSAYETFRKFFRRVKPAVARKDVSKTERFPTVKMSKAAEKRYAKIDADIRAGQNLYRVQDFEDMMRHLNSDE